MLCVLAAAALTDLSPSGPAYAQNVCLDNSCWNEIDYCSSSGWGYYLITDEYSCDYNPNNPSASLNVFLTCYDDTQMFVRYWTRCSY
jgi:hypothetical protein